MDRIRILSMEVMGKHKSDFGVDFTKNKEALAAVSIIRSKELRNEIAGFITKFIKREIRHKKEKEEREKRFDEMAQESRDGKEAEAADDENAVKAAGDEDTVKKSDTN